MQILFVDLPPEALPSMPWLRGRMPEKPSPTYVSIDSKDYYRHCLRADLESLIPGDIALCSIHISFTARFLRNPYYNLYF